jgi:hypothetical protein
VKGALPIKRSEEQPALTNAARSVEMSATFTPYFEAKAHRDPTGSGAYIRVRVPDGPRPDGSILVYLPNGTGLVVNSSQLLHLDAGPNWRGEPGGRTFATRPSVTEPVR